MVMAIGCSTTRSTAGPFVTALGFHQDQLLVHRCAMTYTVEDRTGLMIALLPLLLIAALGGGGGGSMEFSSWEIASKDCKPSNQQIRKAGGE
jgi:hypothetical protein